MKIENNICSLQEKQFRSCLLPAKVISATVLNFTSNNVLSNVSILRKFPDKNNETAGKVFTIFEIEFQ